MIIVRLLSTRASLVGDDTTKVYSGLGAGIVMESITLRTPVSGELVKWRCYVNRAQSEYRWCDRTLELTLMRRIVRTSLAGLFLVVACLAINGALYEMIGRWRDTRRFPE